jgi:uncharacterized membrane protein (UPF0127 family)
MIPDIRIRHSGSPRTLLCALICMIFLVTIADSAAGAEPAGYLREFAQTRAIIETSALACLVLEIYLAESSEQHAQGLMFIDRMDEFEGMLFRYSRDATINMWMKNTHIPLDMLFIRVDGEIVHIARRTQPMSTERISSGQPIRFVLELNGGMTERWSIESGNRLLTIN